MTGKIELGTFPESWRASLSAQMLTIAPDERAESTLHISPTGSGTEALFGAEIRLVADFGTAGKPVLSFRVIGNPSEMTPSETLPILSAARAESWRDNITRDGVLTHQPDGTGMGFAMSFGEADPWSYPELTLEAHEIPTSAYDGIAFTIQVTEGTGILRLQFVEEGGSSYISDMGASADVRTPQNVVVLFADAKWGVWSKTDTDGKLVPADIRRLLVGINSKTGSSVSMNVHDMRWVRLRN